MRLFLQGNLASRLMEGSMQEGEELEHPWLNRSIESAQKKVEQQNYSIRKRLLQYDDVLNQQREVVYGIRNAAIHAPRSKDIIFEQVEEEIASAPRRRRVRRAGRLQSRGRRELRGVGQHAFPDRAQGGGARGRRSPTRSRPRSSSGSRRPTPSRSRSRSPRRSATLERYVVINAIDHHWQEHLTEMEELRRSIGLRSYGQKDPLVEYKGEAYRFFEELMTNVRLQICTGLFRSASNLSSFENMLSILARSARTQGPETAARAAAGRRRRANGAAGPAPAAGRAGAAAAQGDDPARHAQGRAQRPVPLRKRQEVQALPRRLREPP